MIIMNSKNLKRFEKFIIISFNKNILINNSYFKKLKTNN